MQRNLQNTSANEAPVTGAKTQNAVHSTNQKTASNEEEIRKWVQRELTPTFQKHYYYNNGIGVSAFAPKKAVVELLKNKIENSKISIEDIYNMTEAKTGCVIFLDKAERLGIKIYDSFWVPEIPEEETN